MPIKVKHSAGLGALAALTFAGAAGKAGREETQAQLGRSASMSQTAARLGASRDMQAQALAAQRDRQQEQIQAAAQRQSQAADDAAARTALAFGLEEQVKEDAFNRELETIKATAKANAERWEYQYSAKARQDIARGNNALQQIAQMEASGQIDSTTAARMKQPVYNMIAGIQPDQVPVSPDKLPEEMRPGASRFDEHGNFKVRDKDGVERVEQPWYDTPEGRQKLHEQAMELKQLDIQNKELIARQEEADKIREFMYERSQDTVESETGPPRKLSKGEVGRITAGRFGEEAIRRFRGQDLQQTSEAPPAELTTGELEQELQRRVDTVKQARAFLREVKEKYKNNVENIPPEILAEIMRADEIVRQSERR